MPPPPQVWGAVQLPHDETVAHKTPAGFEEQLSDRGRANLERWYARDVAFVRLCRELAPRVNAPDSAAVTA